jgi:MinD-like ATPase involved in chromosome partitioning or flagellar assembly
MPDQADQLRHLALCAPPAAYQAPGGPPLVLVTAGKAGAGASTVAVNLGAALVDAGLRIVFVDASQSQSIAAENSRARQHRTEPFSLERGPADMMLLAAAHTPGSEGDWRRQQQQLLAKLKTLGGLADVAIVDAGSGVTPWARRFWRQARLALVVTTPDDRAIMHCYATLKLAASIDSDAEVRIVVNRCDRPLTGVGVHQRLSSACQRFLGSAVTAAPSLPCHTNSAGRSAPPRVWKSADSPFGHAVLWLGRAAIDVLAAPPATAGLRLAA